jgi:hypothetical protein
MPEVRREAMRLARGDETRLRTVNQRTMVVLNFPGQKLPGMAYRA